MTKPKVIVFGGSGFLGSHVADALSVANFDVTIFDRSPSRWQRADQTIEIGDILDKQHVQRVCQGAKYVYNFAGLADINEAKDAPFETAQLNIMGNLNILEGARIAKATRFVFASSIYVYSDSGSFYRASKQASEKFIELYGERYKLPYTILRFGSLYGRRADMRNRIHQLIHAAMATNVIHYPGSGEELREYIHVVDAAQASIQILDSLYVNQHIVLTGPQLLRVRDLITMIAEMLPAKPTLIFENRQMEAHYNITPYAYRPVIGKKLLVNPFIDIGQGVLDCMHEFSETRHEGSERGLIGE